MTACLGQRTGSTRAVATATGLQQVAVICPRKRAGGGALAAWIELHPGLHYTWKNVKVEGPKGGDFIVTFDFERRCDDEGRWGSGRETVTLDGTCQRVRNVEVHGRKPDAAEGRRGV